MNVMFSSRLLRDMQTSANWDWDPRIRIESPFRDLRHAVGRKGVCMAGDGKDDSHRLHGRTHNGRKTSDCANNDGKCGRVSE